MSVRLAAVTAVAASLFASALPAAAADLYQPYSPRGDAYYDDGPAQYDRYDRYADRYDEPDHPVPPRSVYGGKGFAPPSDWSGYRSRFADDCVPRRVVRARLREYGWHDFHDFERRGDVVLVRARRPSGRMFDLVIDRCSGEVVDAQPLRGRRDFAYRPSRY